MLIHPKKRLKLPFLPSTKLFFIAIITIMVASISTPSCASKSSIKKKPYKRASSAPSKWSKNQSPKKRTVEKSQKRQAKISLRLSWPLKRISISRGFGVRENERHDGIDLSAPKGTPILASSGGRVIFSGNGPTGYGNMVMIMHSKKIITVYAHNFRNIVRKGEWVSHGQTIAYVGKTGRSTGYHLHFELRLNRKAVDPMIYLIK